MTRDLEADMNTLRTVLGLAEKRDFVGAATGGDAASWTPGDGANRFAGSAPIASSAPISTYQRTSAIAASRSLGFSSVMGDGIAMMLPPRPSGALPFLQRSSIVVPRMPGDET